MTDAQIIEPVLLAALAKQGIATGNVELRRDYAPCSRGEGSSPYARTYQDALTKKNFAVISALPGCDAFGQGHELTWRDNNGIIESGNNIFRAVVDKGFLSLLALSDQPWGAKKDEAMAFYPQLFIGGVEIKPASETPKIINDPLNENYAYNTLEWDYGVCKRRIRLIEGRFLGSWIFTVAPKGDVTIKYNQSGKFRLKLQYAEGEDTEFVPKAYFGMAEKWPVILSDSATFYPDANPETSSVDGLVLQAYGSGSGVAWATLVGDAGSSKDDSSNLERAIDILSDTVTDKWRVIFRSLYLFDTSSLADDANISAAILSIRGHSKADNLGITPDINIYSSAPASNTALAAGDYDSLGSTAFCDTAITYAGWNASGYNDFALNASGIAAISKTGVSKFGTRNANYDAANVAPSWSSGLESMLRGYYAEQGVGYQPKLVLAYSTGVTERSAAETGTGTESVISGNPVVIISKAETGTGSEEKVAGNPAVIIGSAETGAGAESLGSLGLVVAETGAGLESLGSRSLDITEAGAGAESLGSRDLGRAETASGLDIASLLASLAGDETGAGAGAALKIAAYFSGDSGLGAELSRMLKNALASDAGLGADGLKSMIKTAGAATDMRLYKGAGQSGPPSRQVRMPSKGVNL